MKNQLRTGVYLSYINLILGAIIPFFYTPVMLRMLGQAEYGLYSLAGSAVSYLGLLSFGFGSTIIRYIAKYRAEGKKDDVEKTFGLFLLAYCGVAILVAICGTIIAANVNNIFHRGLSAEEIAKIKILVYIMTFNTAISFPISVFSSMTTAHERYIYRKSVDMLGTVGAPLANLVALYLGYRSIGLALATTFMQVLCLPLDMTYCFKVLKIHPRFCRMPAALIKEMIGFSVFIFLGSLVDMLFWSTDKVILGMLSGSVAVAIYNVGGTFNNIVMNFSTSISGVLTPRITGMVVKDASKDELTELFIRVGRLQFIVIGLIVSGFTVFGSAFIDMWAGPEYANAYWVAIMTMFPLCIPLIQNTGLSIVVAQNKHKFRSIVYLIIAIINVISTYIIVPYMGYIGAALCSCIAYIAGQGIVMNCYYYKVTGIDIPLFWKNILKMAVIPGTMMVISLIIRSYVHIGNWITFFVGVILYMAIYSVLMYKFTFNQYEKEVIRGPFNKVMAKIRG